MLCNLYAMLFASERKFRVDSDNLVDGVSVANLLVFIHFIIVTLVVLTLFIIYCFIILGKNVGVYPDKNPIDGLCGTIIFDVF